MNFGTLEYPLDILVFGGKGWIGQQLCQVLESRGHTIIHATCRADDTASVQKLLEEKEPHRVVCLVGRTHGEGFTTIDYLEQPGKLVENCRDNLYAPVSLGLLCQDWGVHMTYMGTGCIFEYDAEHPMDGEKGFKEADLPNFFGSSYSVMKGFTDRLMHQLEKDVLNVRIRMPIVGEHHWRNFITKIARYSKVCSVPNSMTVLPTLLPCLADMIEAGDVGTVNLTNPGVISHNDILTLYKEIVDPAFTWENFSVEEQNAVLASRRSNNMLETGRLVERFPNVPGIRVAVVGALQSMAKNQTSSGTS